MVYLTNFEIVCTIRCVNVSLALSVIMFVPSPEVRKQCRSNFGESETIFR